MFTFAGFMIDISNCFLAKAAAWRGARQLALNTALAEYDSVLKETYGLFAMSQHGTSDNDALCERLLDHFGSALGPEGLFGVSLNNFLVSPVAESSLANRGPRKGHSRIHEIQRAGGSRSGPARIAGGFQEARRKDDHSGEKMAVEKELGDLSGTLAEFYGAIQKLDEVQTDYLMREKSFIARIASLSGMDDSESEEYLEAYRAAEEEYSRLHLDSPADFIEYVMSLGEKVRSGLSKMYAANETFAGATESYRQARDGDEDAFYLAMKEESGKYAADFSGGDLERSWNSSGRGCGTCKHEKTEGSKDTWPPRGNKRRAYYPKRSISSLSAAGST